MSRYKFSTAQDKALIVKDDRITEKVEERLKVLLNEGSNAPVDSETTTDCELPEYFDSKKFQLGQQVFYNNVFTMMIAKLSGLVVLLTVPTILDIVMFTKQSNTPCTAFRRYVSTILHTFVWYEKVPNKQTEFFRSVKNVRKKHCIAFRKSHEAGLRQASQLDMVLAQFGFVGFTLLSEKELGVLATYEELDGLVHFWRVIGHLLGIEEKYNLCSGTVEESRELCRRLLEEVFLPSLATKNKHFDGMGHAMIEGLWPVNPHLDTEAFISFTMHLANAATTNNNLSINVDTSKMSMYSKSMLELQLFVHKYLMPTKYWWSTIFRAYFNGQMRLAIFLTEYFPFLAYWLYGTKKSHVDIYKYHLN